MTDSELAARLATARLYVVSADAAPEVQANVLRQALDGGAEVVQLRNKTAAPADLLEAARKVCAHARARDALFVVNDYLDLAIEVGADGVHLGQDDLRLEAARATAADAHWDGLLGRSTHSLDQALEAQRQGADYIGVGPVYATPTKPGRPAVGLELLREVSGAISLPWFAIGGINGANLDDVLGAGATRVAVVRSVCAAPDPFAATRALRARLEQALGAPA
jgi:thiamine-phosphate pyrophosphorylase